MNQNGQKLYIGNLSFDATEEDVSELFSTHGEVKEVKIVTDRYTGRPRGFAFVEMMTSEGASSAKNALDGQQFHGRDLSVDWARARETSKGSEGRGDNRSMAYSGGRREGRDSYRERW